MFLTNGVQSTKYYVLGTKYKVQRTTYKVFFFDFDVILWLGYEGYRVNFKLSMSIIDWMLL